MENYRNILSELVEAINSGNKLRQSMLLLDAQAALSSPEQDKKADLAVEALNNLPYDEEMSHVEAEKILCDFLRETGQGKVADAFDHANQRIGFWYA